MAKKLFVERRPVLVFEKEFYKTVEGRIKTLYGPNGTLSQYLQSLIRKDLQREDEFRP